MLSPHMYWCYPPAVLNSLLSTEPTLYRVKILFAEIEKKVHLAAHDDRKHMADCHLLLSGVTSENHEKNNWIDLWNLIEK